MKQSIFFLVWSGIFQVLIAQIEEGAYLDPPYPHQPLIEDDFFSLTKEYLSQGRSEMKKNVLSSNDVEKVIALQTSVKSQGSRGTCSIFSAIGLLESMLISNQDFPRDIDLSEEWLEYLVMQYKEKNGSNPLENFIALSQFGSLLEKDLPYIGEIWENANFGLAHKRCAHLEGKTLKSCLLGHRDPRLLSASDEALIDQNHELYDPEFLGLRKLAKEFRNQHLSSLKHSYWVYSTSEAKKLLSFGVPLNIGIDFYYGAWNHRIAEELGIERNLDHWNSGIVGYPEIGSIDRIKSKDKPAGHSVIIVGYDDNVQISTKKRMEDGTEKEFTYQGVYYFKNSWGTHSFGKETQIHGKPYPGYGIITQKYVHDFGAFYQLPLKY